MKKDKNVDIEIRVPEIKDVETCLKIAAGAAGALILIKITAKVIRTVKEKKQDKKLKKLDHKVSELEARVARLEK